MPEGAIKTGQPAMSLDFGPILEQIFERLGKNAIYDPDDTAIPLKILPHQPTYIQGFGETQIQFETTLFEVLVSKLPDPEKGKLIAFNGAKYSIKHRKYKGDDRLAWVLACTDKNQEAEIIPLGGLNFVPALAQIFETLGKDAVYDSAGPDEAFLKVLPHQPTEIIGFGETHIQKETTSFELLAADIQRPKKGKIIVLSSVAYVIKNARYKGDDRLIWVVACRPTRGLMYADDAQTDPFYTDDDMTQPLESES